MQKRGRWCIIRANRRRRLTGGLRNAVHIDFEYGLNYLSPWSETHHEDLPKRLNSLSVLVDRQFLQRLALSTRNNASHKPVVRTPDPMRPGAGAISLPHALKAEPLNRKHRRARHARVGKQHLARSEM
jgi:hypothetical protein